MHILATSLDPITTDSGSRILADTLVRDAPPLDLIFVPGGDVNAMMRDEGVLAFLREHGPQAKYVTSVCTGALVLGAAGLLRGYKAATHWTTMDILPIMGAIPVHQRVVTDRNRITGGGVTAGIDFGLTVLADIWGPEVAKTIQLASEYDPAPPFDSGSPAKASPQAIAAVKSMVDEGSKMMKEAALAAAKRFS
jgi:cyclohexyl-isocyanide hydratase